MKKQELIKLNQLKPKSNNPRLIQLAKFEKLKTSLTEFPKMMALRPLIVDRETGEVLGGNMRFRALKELGYTEITRDWIKYADELSYEEKRRFVIVDNLSFGEFDYDLLANEWEAAELIDWGADIPEDWGNDQTDPADQEDYYIAPLNLSTNIQPGDLIEIGHHRLLCGDALNQEDVSKVLGGNKPYLMITDPPYGVNYDPEWRTSQVTKGFGAKLKAVRKVENDDQFDWTDAWRLSPSSVAYVWHGGKFAGEVSQNLRDAEFEIRSQIIWAKPSLTFGRGHYHWKHEPCWYCVKKGKKGNWTGDRKQTTVWEIAGLNPAGRSNDDLDETLGHSTQKPVECMARPMRNHGGDVYDPFHGSGTTMVAAHQNNKRCFAIDIDPVNCQMTIDRMIKLDPDIIIKVNGNDYEQ
jgi:DNA modification methylase